MATINLAEAKAQLSSILDRVEAGESFVITRHGRAVAQVTPAVKPAQQLPVDELARFRDSMPASPQPSADILRAMRGESL